MVETLKNVARDSTPSGTDSRSYIVGVAVATSIECAVVDITQGTETLHIPSDQPNNF